MYTNLARVRMSMSKVKVTRNKKMKNCRVIPLTMYSKACAVGDTHQAATYNTIAWPPGVTGYAGGKISACCLVKVALQANTLHCTDVIYYPPA